MCKEKYIYKVRSFPPVYVIESCSLEESTPLENKSVKISIRHKDRR